MRGYRTIDADLYAAPRPETVARVWDGEGLEAACERWFWVTRHQLAKIAMEGRRRLRLQGRLPPVRSSAVRSTSAEVEAAVVEAVRRLGEIPAAVRETGVTRCVVERILRERGIVLPPAVNRGEVSRRAAETKRIRRAA